MEEVKQGMEGEREKKQKHANPLDTLTNFFLLLLLFFVLLLCLELELKHLLPVLI